MKKEDKQFIYYWYKEFGWKFNPFGERFLEPINKFIVGYEKERRKLNYFVIDKLPLVIINGKEGYGKTTLLLWLKEELNKYKNVVIVDYVSKEIDFAKFIKILLEPFLTIKERLAGFGSKIIDKSLDLIDDKNLHSIFEALYFRKTELDLNKIKEFLSLRLKGKPLVLIVDDFNSLDEKLILLLKVLLESEINVQVAIASAEDIGKFSKKEAIRMTIEGLAEAECVEMVNRRIMNVGDSNLTPFDKETLKSLYKKSRGNPFVFLDLCKEKAVSLALNNLNLKREETNVKERVVEEKKTSVDTKTKENSEPVVSKDKTYEIKVVNPQPTKMYNIKVVQQDTDRTKPKKVKKEKVKPNRVR